MTIPVKLVVYQGDNPQWVTRGKYGKKSNLNNRTAEVRGSNPLGSTNRTASIAAFTISNRALKQSQFCSRIGPWRLIACTGKLMLVASRLHYPASASRGAAAERSVQWSRKLASHARIA
jgi:hypothetical protein